MKISIITVTFNRAHIIKDAIEGVLKQKYKNYEYIVVDGKSKDNTVELLKEYEPKFEGRMRWISEPDKGLYDAINKGIKMTTGDVVGIINSDDYFHRDDVFDKINDAFTDGLTDAIYADDIVEKGSRKLYHSCKSFRPWMYRIGMMPGHATFYAKRELFEKYGYYKTDYKITADFELLVRFVYVNKVRTKYIPFDLMTFRIGGVSSSSFSNKMLLNKETKRALNENGLFCIMPMIWIKYLFKLKRLFV